jgi:hypothetical protein
MLHHLLLLLSFLLLLTPAQAYPKLLADEKRCATPLKVCGCVCVCACVCLCICSCGPCSILSTT